MPTVSRNSDGEHSADYAAETCRRADAARSRLCVCADRYLAADADIMREAMVGSAKCRITHWIGRLFNLEISVSQFLLAVQELFPTCVWQVEEQRDELLAVVRRLGAVRHAECGRRWGHARACKHQHRARVGTPCSLLNDKPELLSYIFHYLDTHTLVFSVQFVCTAWQRACAHTDYGVKVHLDAGSIEHDVCPRPESLQAWAERVPCQFPWIVSLDLSRCTTSARSAVMRCSAAMPHVKSLDMSGCHLIDLGENVFGLHDVYDWHVAMASTSFPYLANLNLRCCTRLTNACIVLLGALVRLKVLVMSRNTAITDMAPLATLRHLRVLDVSACRLIRDFSFTACLVHLTDLDVADTGLTDSGLVPISGLRALETLAISGTAVTDAGFAHLGRLRHLRNLIICRCHRVAGHGIAHFAAHPRLRAITASRCGQITDEFFQHMALLPHLRTLDVAGCQLLVGSCVQALASKSLCELRIDGNYQLGSSAFGQCARLPSLVRLNCSFCVALTDTSFGDISAGLCKLEHLDMTMCCAATDVTCRLLADSMTRIRTMVLRDCHGLSEGGLAHVARMGTLELLDVSNCHCVTDALLDTIVSSLPLLTVLNLRGCRPVSLVGLQSVSRVAAVSLCTRLQAILDTA